MEIVSRKEQPEVTAKVGRLVKKEYPLTPVSSSFITEIGYNKEILIVIGDRGYAYDAPFKLFEGLYYAHSKGTYYNKNIKGIYPSRRFK